MLLLVSLVLCLGPVVFILMLMDIRWFPILAPVNKTAMNILWCT